MPPPLALSPSRPAPGALWALALWAQFTPCCLFLVNVETVTHLLNTDGTSVHDLASTGSPESYEQQVAEIGRAHRLLAAVPRAALAALPAQDLASISESLGQARISLEVIVGLLPGRPGTAALLSTRGTGTERRRSTEHRHGGGRTAADPLMERYGLHSHLIEPGILAADQCQPLWTGTAATKPCLPSPSMPLTAAERDDMAMQPAGTRHGGADERKAGAAGRLYERSTHGSPNGGTAESAPTALALPKSSHRLFVINLLLICCALVFIILYLVFWSPIRGATMSKNRSGSWVVQEHMGTKFLQVLLPFWVPADMANRGYMFCWLLGLTVVTALSMSFLWTMAKVRLALSISPNVFDGYTDSSSRLRFFTDSHLGLGCLGGMCTLPVNFLVFRGQLKGRARQWGLLTVMLFLQFHQGFHAFLGSFVYKSTTNWLVQRQADQFWRWNRSYIVFMDVMNIFYTVLTLYVGTVLNLMWNRFMLNYVLEKYIANRAYYHLNSNSNKDDGTDNPDARIVVDLPAVISGLTGFATSILFLIQGLISAFLIVGETMPFWTTFAVLYTMCGSGVAIWFSWQLLRLNYEIEKKRADFQFSLYNMRSMAEPIALYSGQDAERKMIKQRFESLLEFQLRCLHWGMGFGVFEGIYNWGLSKPPSYLLYQRYFQGMADYGGVVSILGAFANLTSQLNYLHSRTESLAGVGNALTRLSGLLTRIEELNEGSPITVTHQKDSLELQDITVQTPGGGRTLLTGLSLSAGGSTAVRRLLICGPSGVGKSSLLRCIAGLWRNGLGKVTRPEVEDCMFLPQQPYMPVGNLRTQFRYPDVEGQLFDPWEWGSLAPTKDCQWNKKNLHEDTGLMPFLRDVGLEDLPGRFEDGFDQNEDWKRFLSLGEQQRVAAVRCMLKRPSLAVLDEATSALSEIDEHRVYAAFQRLELMYVSVGHRSSLVHFHDQVLVIVDGRTFLFMTPGEYLSWQAEQLAKGKSMD